MTSHVSQDGSQSALFLKRGGGPLKYLACGGDLRLIALITPRESIGRIFTLLARSIHPRLPHQPPDSTATATFRPRVHPRSISRQAPTGSPLA